MKKLGFGCMRLPMIGGAEGRVDIEHFRDMVDMYMAAGFRYFDTAHVYIGGQSETALREALVERYPRDSFILTNKLSGSCYPREADILPLFQTQLDACGVEYFDYYLLHALSEEVYQHVTRCRSFDVVRRLRDEGRIRHIGISFHDKPALLERILTEHPEIEAVQIQLNYVDIDSPVVQSGEVYDVCTRFHKPVIVMEPVKGGALASLSSAASKPLEALNGGSPANYALRYAASFENVRVVLSGMSTREQMAENLRSMANFQPLAERERAAIDSVRSIIRGENAIACTACRYCVPGCPMDIPIPDLISCLNAVRRYKDWPSSYYYTVAVQGRGRASQCVQCGQCARICPQHLPIPSLMTEIAEALEPQTK